MNEAKRYQLQDLIEKIDQVDKMIAIHSGNSSKFMLEQYKAKKEKLLGYLIDELVDSRIRSPYSFRIILLALNKYYPNLTSKSKRSLSKEKHYDELMSLESVLS